MNILAHLYLSQDIGELMLGNFMGDFIKGAQYNNYCSGIKNGILLHRQIDYFVDKHPIHKATRDRFRSKYGLYSGIVVDIIYDHYLSKYWDKYHHLPLTKFSDNVYRYLTRKSFLLPQPLKKILPHMVTNNWLELYGSVAGMARVFQGMSKRTSLPDHSTFAISVLENQYAAIYQEFDIIFNELANHVTDNINLYKFAND